MREVFPENFSFIAQFSLTLRLFKVLQIVRKFLVCKLKKKKKKKCERKKAKSAATGQFCNIFQVELFVNQ